MRGFSGGKIQWEVMSISFVHDFHSKTCSVEDISPSRDNLVLTINQRLVKVKTIKVKGHSRHAKSSEPNTHNRPSSQKKVKAAAIVKACILKDQTTEVSVSGNDVVGLFFLTKLVTIVLAFRFSRFTNKRRRNKRAVHSTEKSPAKYAGNTKHMERVHKNIMLSLEDEHVIEGPGYAERHCI